MNFEFVSPQYLLLLLLLPALIFWLRSRSTASLPPVILFPRSLKFSGQKPTIRTRFLPLLQIFRFAALALIILALARPVIVEARPVNSGKGIDIVLVIDISGSMAETDDSNSTRLETASQVMADFVQSRESDAIGLVAFAAEPLLVSPTTLDHLTLTQLLDHLEIAKDLGVQEGTAIGLGLGAALNLLMDSSSAEQVIVLLSDGRNNSGNISPLDAAREAAEMNISVHTIGFGPLVEDTGPVSENDPENEVFALDEDTLSEIASRTNGMYFRAHDTDGLSKVYKTIDRLEKSQHDIQTLTERVELFSVFLFPAFLCLAVSFVLSKTYLLRLP